MIFKDRAEAAHIISQRLRHYRGKNPLILAIPRGAVPMAKIMADELNGELDVVLVHKLGHPDNPEYAIGAVDEGGHVQGAQGLFTDREYLKEEVQAQIERLKIRRKLYTPIRARIDPKGRIAIVVDDGIATGWTLKAAINALRREKPALIVAAFAVGPLTSVVEIEQLADRVVCLAKPANFQAVGQFFLDFSQVTDDEVKAILQSTSIRD